jgi:hypothetical protein
MGICYFCQTNKARTFSAIRLETFLTFKFDSKQPTNYRVRPRNLPINLKRDWARIKLFSRFFMESRLFQGLLWKARFSSLFQSGAIFYQIKVSFYERYLFDTGRP